MKRRPGPPRNVGAIPCGHDAKASRAINVAHDGGLPPRDTIGLDLPKRETQLGVLAVDGTARGSAPSRGRTSGTRLTGGLAKRGPPTSLHHWAHRDTTTTAEGEGPRALPRAEQRFAMNQHAERPRKPNRRTGHAFAEAYPGADRPAYQPAEQHRCSEEGEHTER